MKVNEMGSHPVVNSSFLGLLVVGQFSNSARQLDANRQLLPHSQSQSLRMLIGMLFVSVFVVFVFLVFEAMLVRDERVEFAPDSDAGGGGFPPLLQQGGKVSSGIISEEANRRRRPGIRCL